MTNTEPAPSVRPAAPKGPRLSGRAKFLVDFGPLLAFFVAYFLGHRIAPVAGGLFGQDWAVPEGEELFLAMAIFMPVFAVAFVYSVWKERRVAPMLLVSGVVVGILGSLALIFHNRIFVYMKPTVAYGLFAITLAGGLATGRNFLKTLFDGALHLPDDVWRTLTKRYAAFFVLLAIINEIAWRYLMRECDVTASLKCAGEPTWVNLKIFGFTAINIIFTATQIPLIAKHMPDDTKNKAESTAKDHRPDS